MKLLPVSETLQILADSDVFKDWKNNHDNVFLSHFFCPLDSESNPKTNWEIGYFDDVDKKSTVFALNPDNSVVIKPADEVLAKDLSSIEKLDLEKIIVPFEKARAILKEKQEDFFPGEKIGEGFIILQILTSKTMWNFTCITRSLKFANVKIDAVDGTIISHELVNVIQST